MSSETATNIINAKINILVSFIVICFLEQATNYFFLTAYHNISFKLIFRKIKELEKNKEYFFLNTLVRDFLFDTLIK